VAVDVKTEPDLTDDAVATEVGAGWWIAHLSRQLYDPKRLRRLELLDSWYRGEPPLPGVPKAAQSAVHAVIELADTNWALTIAEAVRNRQLICGIRTSADDDATGDGDAYKLWLDMKMPVVSADAHRLKARFGTSFVLTQGPKKDRPGIPVATAEDPRYTVADVEPDRPWLVRAGLKMLHDPVRKVTRAYLYRRGRVDVAQSPAGTRDSARFNADTWAWVEPTGPFSDPDLMPLEMFEALDGVGEYELFLRTMRRCNFQVLQHLTIAMMQAFKQRVLKGLPARDDKGNLIDYTEMFPADPASVWLLPGAGEVWESGQVDLTGALSAVRDTTRQLAASSSTPMYMFDAGGENQSAEGAALADAGLVFKVRDRNSRDEVRWVEQIKTSYRWLGKSIDGVSMMWVDPKMIGLSEQASALAQFAAGGMPFRSRFIAVGFNPAEVDRMEVEREDDQVFAQRVASMKAELDAQTAQRAAEATAKAQAAAGVQPAPANQPQNGAQAGQGGTNGAPASGGTPKPGPGPQKPAQARNGATA
jgi:hypothetical protein